MLPTFRFEKAYILQPNNILPKKKLSKTNIGIQI
jgi:hypothetical protein